MIDSNFFQACKKCLKKLKKIMHVNITKRWSKGESFTIFENHVYTSKKNLMFAQKFEATPFLVGSFFVL